MRLWIDGNIQRYYVQTLCMIFFPGAKFPENEPESPQIPQLSLRLEESKETIGAFGRLIFQGRTLDAQCILPREGDTEDLLRKRAAGAAILEMGSKLLGFQPAWGILTGVRPSKFASELAEMAGGSWDTVFRRLTGDFFVSREKAELALQVATWEEELIRKTPPQSCSVYVSIPFCPSRCQYCSFVSGASPRLLAMIPDYLTRLFEDLRQIGATLRQIGQKPISVYIGGGTPTILSETQLEMLFAALHESLDFSEVKEFTLEGGRPDTVTAGKLAVAKRCGVNRMSVNPQTLRNDVLQKIGRHHTVEDFFRAYEIARESGIPCINTDMIVGLPGDDAYGVESSLEGLLALHPENLTVHSLCMKNAADLHKAEADEAARRQKLEQILPPQRQMTQSWVSDCVNRTLQRARECGYRPYYMYRQKNTVDNLENVGYALPGTEGLYNIYMMEEVHSIFAAGAGAVTKLVSPDRKRIERLFTPKYHYEYLAQDGAARMKEQSRQILRFVQETEEGANDGNESKV